ncbi:CinA family protein [Aquaspirillum serpens]|uniref:CinA family protein n=1 Tax=Aquaspirillum serpens TaxID=190 RepID=UPI0003B2EDD7|nr:CinA family protein [Aquaspirillum serpens]
MIDLFPLQDDIQHSAQALAQQLLQRGETVATAESCTGGLIAATLTEIAGSSAWFGWGVVSYANEAKQQLLQVNAHTLATDGAVSQAVVEQMAIGVRQLSGANWSIAVSGIAGPSGDSVDKPVGTVWIAVAGAQGCTSRCHLFTGDRQHIRAHTVLMALQQLQLALTVSDNQ